ncbi:hypothetical protein [Campylobacter sp.]|uniref:hypothetical protein n=1 Tax=Campylobacter sp. TaxID=205 RepID=UPI002AA62F99|nr:hypothetical protein [Campylobacter sp.]MCI6662567.1 hypothetical protein [Campylobacter sp.]
MEPKEVAIEEVLEETGYAVPSVNYITSSFTGLGFSANLLPLYKHYMVRLLLDNLTFYFLK